MAGKSQRAWLQRNVGAFLQQYTRKSQRGQEPNDRGYSRDMEREIKQLSPEELNDILNGEVDLPPLKPKKQVKDSNF